ncbi:MAG: RNA polymerase sigma factor [Prevotellaceae bacterium]|nr:RNA polymerase sigma factor [Prevotellaceae bacterium]
MINFNKDVMPLKNKFYRLALRVLHNHEEAQDVTQETLIRLWRRSETLANADEAEALGLTICHNLAIDTYRREGRDHDNLDDDQINLADTALSPLETISRNQQRQLLLKQINTLPDRQKYVLQLRDIEGLSYKKIADALNMSEEQVKINLFRARQALKNSFKNKERDGL